MIKLGLKLFPLFLTVFGCSHLVSAQLPSLAGVGNSTFTSDADGFQISSPDKCFKLSTNDLGGHSYICDVKEGRISVIVNPGDPKVKTEADITKMIETAEPSAFQTEGVTYLGKAPLEFGIYRGLGIKLNSGGDIIMAVTLMAVNKPQFNLAIRATKGVKDSEKLLYDVIDSFKIISPKTK